jgi:uncharacterized membrane protein YidH (DUF202 family)
MCRSLCARSTAVSFARPREVPLSWLGVVTRDAADRCHGELAGLGLRRGAGLHRGLAVLLVVLGIASALVAWIRWWLAERAMRRRAPLPSFGFGVLFSGSLVLTAVVLVVMGL